MGHAPAAFRFTTNFPRTALRSTGRDPMGATTREGYHRCLAKQVMERPMKRNDLSQSLVVFEQHSTLVAVIEMGLKSWLVAGLVPGLVRQPLKRQAADEKLLVKQLYRWRDEAIKADSTIKRIAVAFEAGRDGFWLARWLRAHGSRHT